MQNFRLKNLKPKIQNCLTQGLGFEPRTSDLESRGVAVTPSLRWQWRDLNPHIPGYEPGALPLSYTAIAPEVRAGFEPALIGFADQRLQPLGYLTIWESRRDSHSQSSA